jgi:hypothetical protein
MSSLAKLKISALSSLQVLSHLLERKKNMCQFTELTAFTQAVEALRTNCCLNEKYPGQEEFLKKAWNRFTSNLAKTLTEQDTREKLSIFLTVVQHNLTEFADDLYHKSSNYSACKHSCPMIIPVFLNDIFNEIIVMLEYYKLNYPDHFDLNAKIPFGLPGLNKDRILGQKNIIAGLNKRNIDPQLIQIIDDYTRALFMPGDFRLENWGQYYYLENLISKLNHFLESADTPEETFKLIKLLIGYNFNPIEFYDFMLEYSSKLVNPDMPYEEQELELLLLLKTIQNIRPESNSGYNLQIPTISESLSGYISRELDTLSKMKSVMMLNAVNSKSGRKSSYYFDVSMTLEELFFLLKIMVEVRLIKTKFKSNLYSFVATHIRTERTKNPSEQYMRNIFGPNREVPSRVIRKVRTWLMTILNYIDTHFGDQLKMWFFAVGTHSFIIEILVF